ncbi:SMI1/KNR4 family protein [Streptomyces sp. NPDC087440]|uniref:SMI1/KNR4 family protein n=1 Tax=Streptomyces sp. NPDC087440 TaxID=3365790 RepID=UPI0037F3C319
MNTHAFNWRRFLVRWSEEWADVQEEGQPAEDGRPHAWLGGEPASEADLTAMEARLGCAMPPSYREFLRVSDGWRHAGGFVWQLAGTREAHWHEDASGLGEDFDVYWDEEGNPPEVRAQVGLWARALRLDVESDATYVLLDPQDVGPDGEWAVRVWAGRHAADPVRYASFAEFMVDMHREFHSLQAGREEPDGSPAFVNATTRTQDAAVERARAAALGGRPEEAARLLVEAAKYGRPRTDELLGQIGRLNGTREAGRRLPHPDNPRFRTELFPLQVVGLRHREDPLDERLRIDPEAFPDAARAADAILREMRAGTYRYRPGGAFGEAVDRAYELARWGDTDGAWHTLRAAIRLWQPLGPDHIAPLGLLADPVLAPVLTPARRLELLATPRGGVPGPAPEPAPDEDTGGGLSWLARPGELRWSAQTPGEYQMILVEGAAPDELPGLVGSVGGAGGRPLSPPLRGDEVDPYHRVGRGPFSTSDDPVLFRVGRTAAGDWSFAFDDNPAPFDAERFVSPAPSASAGGRRAIAVRADRWGGRPPLLHVSSARNGTMRYAFTLRGDGPAETGTGEVPAGLLPAAHTPFAAAGAHVLDALAARYGISLPRFALATGRLHSFAAPPWVPLPPERRIGGPMSVP